MNLFHVLANERVRKPGCGGNLLDVIIRRLRVVADGQRIIDEMIGGPGANLKQFCCRERRKRFTIRLLIEQIATNQSAVGLADLNERLARAVVRQSHDIQTLVSSAFSE